MLEEFDDVRVLLVANQPILAEALAVRIADEPGLVFVGASDDWATATRTMAVDPPDVVIIDVALLPDGAPPIGAVERIDGDTRVILVVQDERPELARSALLRGAAGLVSTSSSTAELIDAIRAVARGVVWLQARVMREVLESTTVVADAAGDEVLALLTPREREVLGLMAAGRARREIADELFLSVNTVRTHTQNLLAKLNVHSSLEAVVVAMRSGMPPATSASP